VLYTPKTQVLRGVQFAYTSIFFAQGRPELNLGVVFIINITNIFLNFVFSEGWFGIVPMGVEGVAIATVISVLFGLGISMLMVHQGLGITFFFGMNLPSMLHRFSSHFLGFTYLEHLNLLATRSIRSS
jgi:Na+-driven multidrug efflux pump